MNQRLIKYFIIGTFVGLYLAVSVISTIHVVEFFELTNPRWLAISLAVAFELGAAASLASIIALDKMNQTLVWVLFITLTLMQSMGNSYWAYSHAHDFSSWSELFGLSEEDVIYQKRILSLISGAILPLVALGFIKSLVDYIRPTQSLTSENLDPTNLHEIQKESTHEERVEKKYPEIIQDEMVLVEIEPEYKVGEVQEEEKSESSTDENTKEEGPKRNYEDPLFSKYISGKPYPTNLT
jgi:hypothetical protein